MGRSSRSPDGLCGGGGGRGSSRGRRWWAGWWLVTTGVGARRGHGARRPPLVVPARPSAEATFLDVGKRHGVSIGRSGEVRIEAPPRSGEVSVARLHLREHADRSPNSRNRTKSTHFGGRAARTARSMGPPAVRADADRFRRRPRCSRSPRGTPDVISDPALPATQIPVECGLQDCGAGKRGLAGSVAATPTCLHTAPNRCELAAMGWALTRTRKKTRDAERKPQGLGEGRPFLRRPSSARRARLLEACDGRVRSTDRTPVGRATCIRTASTGDPR